MEERAFVTWSSEQQRRYVEDNFFFRPGAGWFNGEGDFCGLSCADVIAALIDLEYAEINSIGDCMSGFCVTPPNLTDFVKNKG